MDSVLALHRNEKDVVANHDDILTRRLKNRERQRRYRARKRHLADMRTPLIAGSSNPLQSEQMPGEFHSVPVQIEISTNLPSLGFQTRVYCQRDWKKDARNAYIHKQQEIRSISLSNSKATNPGVTQVPSWQSAAGADILSVHSGTPVQDNDGAQRSMSSRRHWKAEARNKRSSEAERPIH